VTETPSPETTGDNPISLDQQLSLKTAAGRLATTFAGVFGAETI
jgi:hypothetical protein